MSENLLTANILEPRVPATASIVCLHGLGADGHDLSAIVGELGLPVRHPVRFIFPHAPYRAVTINNGYVMRAWYDIVASDLSRQEDRMGIDASARQINALVQREITSGILAQRIVLAGFSQGGAIALHTGLRYPERLGGILALSAYLPLAASLPAEAHSANAGLPIMLAHGTYDNVIPLAHAVRSRDVLQAQGYELAWQSYPVAHGLGQQELLDTGAWLRRILEIPS